MAEIDDLRLENEKLKSRLGKAVEVFQEQKTQIENLTNERNKFSNDYQETYKLKGELESKVSELNSEIFNLTNKNGEEVDKLDEEIKNLKSSLETKSSELETKSSEYETLKGEKEELDKKMELVVSRAKDKIEELQNLVKVKEEEKTQEIEKLIETSKNEKQTLQEKISYFEELCKKKDECIKTHGEIIQEEVRQLCQFCGIEISFPKLEEE